MEFEHLNSTDSESDVEQKVLYPLITQVLGYASLEIKTKDYLAPTDIDKGAGKKVGYYPDYIIYLGGMPVLVVEAKDPSTDCSVGYREARLYATELNKHYPESINPVCRVMASNGIEVVFSSWDSETNVESGRVEELNEGAAFRTIIKARLGKDSLYKHSQTIRGLLTPAKYHKPLLMIGGPSRQNETIPPNTFAAELAPLLRKFFDPDETAHSIEIIERGYCSTKEVTKYNATLESLLKDRIPNQDSFSTVQTTKTNADSVDQALRVAIDQRQDVPDPFIMLVGSVGAGKSMFIERYLRHLVHPDIKKNTVWVIVNFNEAPSDLTNAESWLCAQFVKSYEAVCEDEEPLSYENLNRYFSPDIARRKSGPYKLLFENNRKEYELRLSDDLANWVDDPIKLSSGIIRFITKDKGIPLVVVFDNVDRRDRDQQLSIFQAVQWFRHNNKCFTILSLRDETFDAYKDQPPLDAFLKPFAFRITAPSFITVARKRLELALEHLTKHAEKTQIFTLSNGASVIYPSTNIGRYLLSVYISIFNPKRSVRVILEALSGRNIRRALEMFTEILMSGYLSEGRLISISEGYGKSVPEWLIIKVLMRTNYKYYADNHGYVTNIFDLPENSSSANNFLLIEVLEFLVANRKKYTGFKLEGYQHVTHMLEILSEYGYSKEDLMWALEKCLNEGLIIADHQRMKNVSPSDYVKVSAAGFYHLRFLAKRAVYLENVSLDTYFSDRDFAVRIAAVDTDRRTHAEKRITELRKYLDLERIRYGELFPSYLSENDPAVKQMERIDEAIAFIGKADNKDIETQQDLF